MRCWLLPVALCACVTPTSSAPGPTTGSDVHLVSAFPAGAASASPVAAPIESGWLVARTMQPRHAGRSLEQSSEENTEDPSTDPAAAAADATESPQRSDGSTLLAQQILSRPDLAAYHGWIRYL